MAQTLKPEAKRMLLFPAFFHQATLLPPLRLSHKTINKGVECCKERRAENGNLASQETG